MRRRGFKIVAAIKGPGSIEDGIEFLKTYDIVVHERCAHTIEELTLFAWKTDPVTGEILPVLADKDNHVIDAARYGVEAIRRAPLARPATPPSTNPTDLWGRKKGAPNKWKTA